MDLWEIAKAITTSGLKIAKAITTSGLKIAKAITTSGQCIDRDVAIATLRNLEATDRDFNKSRLGTEIHNI